VNMLFLHYYNQPGARAQVLRLSETLQPLQKDGFESGDTDNGWIADPPLP